ncbi:hypothetical protein ACSNO4_08290 [Kocuria flava]|uniref:hypothetical protein n=1 Tax=Kocuria flava TaxID=446860 RepID=UPI003F1B6748
MKTMAVTTVLLAGALTALSTAPAPVIATSLTPATASDRAPQLPAYLQGYRQGQLLCPGAALTGKVSVAIIDPMMATTDAPGDCTLRDMKAANPDTQFLAYLNVGAMRPWEHWNGIFQNSCADMSDRRSVQFAVTTTNPAVATTPAGHAGYPDFTYLTVANLSPAYAKACAETAHTILTTDAERGSTDAPPARFDGIFLDDTSLSPAHGQDMVDIGQWGPWADDDAYGRAMIDTVTRIDSALTESMGTDVPVAMNLGLYPAWNNQVDLALELAATGAVDFALREHSTAESTGAPFSPERMHEEAAAFRAITTAGLPIVQHDYSVPLRQLPATAYDRGLPIDGTAPCLRDDSENRAQVVDAADHRRTLDHRLTLGNVLLHRTPDTTTMTATLNQAEPTCQDNAWDDDRHWEDVTRASVETTDPQTTALTQALTSSAHPVASPFQDNGVLITKLSDGSVLAVNQNLDTRSVHIFGTDLTIPGRSATID